MGCEWCRNIYRVEDRIDLIEYRDASEYIYFDGKDFMYYCDDCTYDFPMRYCPNCGKKLEIKNEEI